MMVQENSRESFQILVVDDEPDVLSLTQLSLKGVQFQGKPVELLEATSGRQTVEMMRSHPEIAVILLDVVMESDSAGLDACRTIRNQLNNPFVRILLRTGQPGSAPERETIEQYDVDGYLSKAELTSNHLYTAIRTSLKAWRELMELERYRQNLAEIHRCAISIHTFDPLEETLDRILGSAVTLCPTPLAVLLLETFEEQGNPRRYLMHLSRQGDALVAEADAQLVVARVTQRHVEQPSHEIERFAEGVLIPLRLHHELGQGWIYLKSVDPDDLTSKALELLTGHAANALYSSIAQVMLEGRDDWADGVVV